MTVFCPHCSQQVEVADPIAPDQPAQCPNCTNLIAPQPPAPMQPPYPAKRGMSGGKIVAIVVGVLLVLFIGVGGIIFIGAMKLANTIDSGQRARVQADLSAFKIALNLYRTDAGTYPSTEQGLKALVEKPTGGSVAKNWAPYMNGEQLDPWGHPYGYLWPPQKNADKPDIFSFGPDGEEGTDDDIGNWD